MTVEPGVPNVVEQAIRSGIWRDPGPVTLSQILAVRDLPEMMLFETVDVMRSVARMLDVSEYLGDAAFCMVRQKTDLLSADDRRLVFSRALFIAGSRMPGEDVLVAVDDAAADTARVVAFDWNRPVPSRWVPLMTISEFVQALHRIRHH